MDQRYNYFCFYHMLMICDQHRNYDIPLCLLMTQICVAQAMIKTLPARVHDEMQKINELFLSNKLSLNAQKTE